MAKLFRRQFQLLLLPGMILLTGCYGCREAHQTVTPDAIEQIKADESLTDSEAVEKLAAAVFRTEFGDQVSSKRNKGGGYSAFVWIKEWNHQDLPDDLMFLKKPGAADTETVVLMQEIKADAYRKVALRMDEYVEGLASRPLDVIIVRLGRRFQRQGGDFHLLQVEVKKEDFPRLHEALGDNRTRLYTASDEDVITTMDGIWKVTTDRFPKPAA